MSVSNEIKRLRRRVRKAKASLEPVAVLEHGAAVADRLARQRAGEDVSAYEMPPSPFPAGYATGARNRLAQRILEIAERRERAEHRDRERGLELHAMRATLDAAIDERMKAIDAETRGEATAQPHTKLLAEKGNPIISILERRATTRQFTVEEGGEDEHSND